METTQTPKVTEDLIERCVTAAKYVGPLNPIFKPYCAVDPDKIKVSDLTNMAKRVVIINDPGHGDQRAYNLILNLVHAQGYVIFNGPTIYQYPASHLMDIFTGKRNRRSAIVCSNQEASEIRAFDRSTLFLCTSLVAPALLAQSMRLSPTVDRITATYHKAVMWAKQARGIFSGLYGYNGFMVSSLPSSNDLVILDQEEVVDDYSEYASAKKLQFAKYHIK